MSLFFKGHNTYMTDTNALEISKGVCVLVQWVALPPVRPTLCSTHSTYLPINATGRAAGHCTRTCATATNVGSPCGIPGSLLIPGPMPIWAVSQVNE